MTPPDLAPPPPTPSDAPQAEATIPWQRLRRRMLLVLPLKELLSFIWAIVATIFLSRRSGDDGPPWFTLSIMSVLIVLGVGKWFTTTYRVTDHRFEVRTGLLKRSTTHAVRGAIRSVDTESSLLYRALGITKVSVVTGNGDPVHLDAVTTDDAAQLRDILGTSGATPRPENTSGATQEPPAPARGEIPITAFAARWLRAVPFSGAGLAAALGVVAAGFQLLRRYIRDDEFGDAMQQGATWAESFGLMTFSLLALVAVVVVILGTSLALYLVRFGSYRLWAEPHASGVSLRGTRGLLTTSNTSTDFARVHGVKVRDGYVARLGRVREAHLLVGGASALTTRDSKESSHLMPLAPRADVTTATTATLSLGSLPPVAQAYAEAPRRRRRNPRPLTLSRDAVHDACTRPLLQHGRRARRRLHLRGLLWGSLPLLLLTVLEVTDWLHSVPLAIWACAAVPVALSPLLAEDRYRNLGHAVTPELLIAQSVGWTRCRTIIGTHAIIGWQQRSTYFQRRLGLVTLYAATSTGLEPVTITDVPAELVPGIVAVATPSLTTPH